PGTRRNHEPSRSALTRPLPVRHGGRARHRTRRPGRRRSHARSRGRGGTRRPAVCVLRARRGARIARRGRRPPPVAVTTWAPDYGFFLNDPNVLGKSFSARYSGPTYPLDVSARYIDARGGRFPWPAGNAG